MMTKKEDLHISGLMKTTLLDYPGKVACTVFLAGCNMRCPFCHNPRVVFGKDERLDNNEVFYFLKKRSGILDGVCITGGEPTLCGDALTDLAVYIKSLGFLVKLDTNGTNPDLLSHLIENKLVDYVAMDVKSALTASEYEKACGCKTDLDKIKKSISILKENNVDCEFRTTLVRGIHTKNDIISAASSLSGGKRYFLQSFVDSGELIDNISPLSAFTKDEMQEMANEAAKFIESSVRGV